MPSLSGFSGVGYTRGRPLHVQAAWYIVLNLIFIKWWLPARLRPHILRWFGAQVGSGVIIRPRARVHWPWKLSIGDHCWIGEEAWLLNLEPITISHDVCISQGAFLCTGSHDRRSPTFEFDNGPINIQAEAWIAARATVLRGVTVGQAAVVAAGSVAYADVPDHSVLTNVPNRLLREPTLTSARHPSDLPSTTPPSLRPRG